MQNLEERLKFLQKKSEEDYSVAIIEAKDLYFEIKDWLENNPDQTLGHIKTRTQIHALKLWAKLSLKNKEQSELVKEEALGLISIFFKKSDSYYFSHATKIIDNILPMLKQN